MGLSDPQVVERGERKRARLTVVTVFILSPINRPIRVHLQEEFLLAE